MTTDSPETELFFPLRLLGQLRDLRSDEWKKLVDQITKIRMPDLNTMAMQLMMARLTGCINCDSDSFRAMRGCEFCSKQTIRRFKGNDSDLVKTFENAKTEVKEFLNKQSHGRN